MVLVYSLPPSLRRSTQTIDCSLAAVSRLHAVLKDSFQGLGEGDYEDEKDFRDYIRDLGAASRGAQRGGAAICDDDPRQLLPVQNGGSCVTGFTARCRMLSLETKRLGAATSKNRTPSRAGTAMRVRPEIGTHSYVTLQILHRATCQDPLAD